MKPLTVLCLALLACLSGFGQRISVQPSTLDFRVAPGASQSQTISLSNFSDKKVAFQAYINDWLRDSTGAHQYFRADTLRRSCATWVQLSRNFIELEPGQSTQLVVQLQGPADSAEFRQMKWAMLFLHTVEEQDSATRRQKQLQATIKESFRIGVHIYQTPPALGLRKVKALALRPAADAPDVYELKMRNTGEMMVNCKAYINLTEVATGRQYKTELVDFPVFPEGVRKVRIKLPSDLPAGTYSALGVLDLGGDVPLEGIEKTIEVKPAVANGANGK
ncbi:hypothetical protein EPD60_15145 [Flaviaesturariibacter flavus]|uniref:Molecular chaperone n=1 Tax=Flaviaesturariibacter flavus TaxID=2502780 RepID=A0A4R1B3D7_9BACT|nr:hypothetical protein [Flaviaesturariibacter flavus]TCJ12602.1 hypothetical protein EPD60_15145 [Flaviaesturariibacter flavus]